MGTSLKWIFLIVVGALIGLGVKSLSNSFFAGQMCGIGLVVLNHLFLEATKKDKR